jgi:hypothetical protein
MAKHGQHQNDAVNPQQPRGHEKSRGHNNPSKSVDITTGTSKKGGDRADGDRPAQHQKNEWNHDIRESPSIEGSTRARDSDLTSGRSGTDSNRG